MEIKGFHMILLSWRKRPSGFFFPQNHIFFNLENLIKISEVTFYLIAIFSPS